MTKGLLYVVFGKEYDRMAARCIAIARRFTNIPICILTNLEERDAKWNKIKNIEFRYIPLPTEENRDVKTRMIEYTPFDLSLYMDCDTIICNKGIEKVFDMLGNKDMLVQQYKIFKERGPVLYVYKKMMKQTGTELPLVRYLGGFVLFGKNKRTYNFFHTWNGYYKIGTGADMPAFCCAIKNCNVFISVITDKDRVFAPHQRRGYIVQHNFKGKLNHKYNIPKWEPWRVFDVDHDKNMSWVDF